METNRLQLLEAGLLSEHIEIAGICTYIRYEDYFSARRLGVKKRPDPYRDMLEKILVILAQTYNRHDFNHSFHLRYRRLAPIFTCWLSPAK